MPAPRSGGSTTGTQRVWRSSNQLKGKTVETVIIEPHTSFMSRVGRRLRNWGGNIAGFAKKVGNWFLRIAKKAYGYIKPATLWVWRSKPVQWVVIKATFIGAFIWHYAKGPVLWFALPVGMILFAPKAVAIMLLTVVITLIALVYVVYRISKNTSPEEFVDKVADRLSLVTNTNNDIPLAFENELTPEETTDSRYAYLDEQMDHAAARNMPDRYAELFARMFLLRVRDGKGPIKKDSSVPKIHAQAKQAGAAESQEFPWNTGLMYRAAQDENKRTKDRDRLRAERNKLTPVT